ncbi:MAG: ImmA/IrrE family metallo-endopeptidase [Cellvibrionaceae bacterium]|nr:ImmA/IrrE family metallo-endopeptidase [Cellvibrionaceae bacterium]
MSSYTEDQVSSLRRLLCNPYALMELLEESHAAASQQEALTPPSTYVEASPKDVHKSREQSQDPYSHLNGEGDFEGLLPSSRTPEESVVHAPSNAVPKTNTKSLTRYDSSRKKYSEDEIKNAARKAHIDLWRNRKALWGGNPPSDPIEILSPLHAAHFYGYASESVAGFGPLLKGNDIAEIAGYLDNEKKKIFISDQFSSEKQLFTASHEIGHILLHGQTLERFHRDRPVDGSTFSRDPVEREADKFAAYFLMPEKLVRDHFESRFRVKALAINEEVAYGLGLSGVEELKARAKNKKGVCVSDCLKHKLSFQTF